jgi:hypothetical protein
MSLSPLIPVCFESSVTLCQAPSLMRAKIFVADIVICRHDILVVNISGVERQVGFEVIIFRYFVHCFYRKMSKNDVL